MQASAAVPLTDPEGASVSTGLATTPPLLAADTASAAGATAASWTEVFVKAGVMVGRDVTAAYLSSGITVVTADMSVASWTNMSAETAAVFS